MTTAEVNAAIAKVKGWERSPYSAPDLLWRDPVSRHCHSDPTDDPREWSRLLEEMVEGVSEGLIVDGGPPRILMWMPDDVEARTEFQCDTLGEVVCRAWLAWKGVSDV